jgi:hypothetical protein
MILRLRFQTAILLAGTALVAAVRQAAAQEAAQPVAYASYLECNEAEVARVDSLVTTFWGPLADRQVSAGKATAWGWLAHHTGGTWDRVFYFISPDTDSAVDAVEGLLGDAGANSDLVDQTNRACPDHEDAIWQRVAGSQPVAQFSIARPAAGYSIYYVCDPSREERADEIVTTAIAPTLDRAVQSGVMHSWSWLRHLVGGKYRRLLVTDGSDAKSLIGALGGSVPNELRAQQTEAFREFSDICSSHQDQVWTIQIAKP